MLLIMNQMAIGALSSNSKVGGPRHVSGLYHAQGLVLRTPSCNVGPISSKNTIITTSIKASQSPSINATEDESIVPTRRLGAQEALEALQRANSLGMEQHGVVSFYSSQLGGIVTDGRMMGMHVDESVVMHGHGVYDRIVVMDGHMYQLDARVDRLMEMCDRANIRLPKKWHREQLKRIVLETVAAGKCMEGSVTVVVSLGRSRGVSFATSMEAEGLPSIEASLYILVSREDVKKAESDQYLKGYSVKTSQVPCKFGYFARLKSTDRLQDTMVVLDARADGCHTGVMVDNEGNVAGVPDANVAFVTKDGTFVVPESEGTMPTLTMSRLLQLINENQKDVQISRIEKRSVSVEEAKGGDIAEMMLIGSQYPVVPVVSWDGAVVGDGEAGIVALQLRTLLQADVYPHVSSDSSLSLYTEIPYGYLTGMT